MPACVSVYVGVYVGARRVSVCQRGQERNIELSFLRVFLAQFSVFSEVDMSGSVNFPAEKSRRSRAHILKSTSTHFCAQMLFALVYELTYVELFKPFIC